MKQIPYLGVGIGLRRVHFNDVLLSTQGIDWFELLSENYMKFGGRPKIILEHLISKKVPLIPHGVELSLGSLDELDKNYLLKLEELLKLTKPAWFSDHLCFSSFGKVHYHDLIPVLLTNESLEHISDRIKLIQDRFQIPFAIENISYYVNSCHHKMEEFEFIHKLVDKTDVALLLDVNNVYVNSINHDFDAIEYINHLPLKNVIQIHLAGHWNRGDIIIDTHGNHIINEVWELYRYSLKKIKRPISTLIEWDNNIPDYKELIQITSKARDILNNQFSSEVNSWI